MSEVVASELQQLADRYGVSPVGKTSDGEPVYTIHALFKVLRKANLQPPIYGLPRGEGMING